MTVNDGVFSPWNGHRPFQLAPALRSWTVSPIRSTRLIFCLISAATPTDVVDLRVLLLHGYLLGRGTVAARVVARQHPPWDAPDTRMALSSLDKAQNWILPLDKTLDNPFQGRICQ